MNLYKSQATDSAKERNFLIYMNSHSIRNQSCPNQACKKYAELGELNVIIHAQNPTRFKCKECKKTWVAHRNNALAYKLKTKPETIFEAMELIHNGSSIRKVAGKFAVSPSTVQRWSLRSRKQNSTIQHNSFSDILCKSNLA